MFRVLLTELVQALDYSKSGAGNDLTFEDLTIQFIVDEDLETYTQIHDYALAQMDSDDKYRALITEGKDAGIQQQTSMPGDSLLRR